MSEATFQILSLVIAKSVDFEFKIGFTKACKAVSVLRGKGNYTSYETLSIFFL